MNREELALLVEQTNTEIVRLVREEVPFANHLISSETPLHVGYYLRHRIETVKRIRLTAKTDALALAGLIDTDYEAARHWAEYTSEELGHDRLYLADLNRHGYSDEEVLSLPSLHSTRKMLDYLNSHLATDGPLTAVAYSLFVEWNSARASEAAVSKAENAFTQQHVKGARAHLGIDIKEDHYEMMLDIAWRLVELNASSATLVRLLNEIGGFFADYFRELHDVTVASAVMA